MQCIEHLDGHGVGLEFLGEVSPIRASMRIQWRGRRFLRGHKCG